MPQTAELHPLTIEFATLIVALAKFFDAEPAAMSVEHEKFGEIRRSDVARLLPDAEPVFEGSLDAVAKIGVFPTVRVTETAIPSDVLAREVSGAEALEIGR